VFTGISRAPRASRARASRHAARVAVARARARIAVFGFRVAPSPRATRVNQRQKTCRIKRNVLDSN